MKTPPTNDRYAYRVTRSEEDEQYVGLCAEFPSLSWLASTPEKALRGIRRVVANAVQDMKTNREPVPEPLGSHRYSGKFMVRVPPEVHRQPAIEAAEEDISLNRLVSAKLSSRD
jgi:predicted HicB family RNase H-like nuclease